MHHSFAVQLVPKVVKCFFPTNHENHSMTGRIFEHAEVVITVALPVNNVVAMFYCYLLSSQHKISVGIRLIHTMLKQPAHW
jgi:hypothetical protein